MRQTGLTCSSPCAMRLLRRARAVSLLARRSRIFQVQPARVRIHTLTARRARTLLLRRELRTCTARSSSSLRSIARMRGTRLCGTGCTCAHSRSRLRSRFAKQAPPCRAGRRPGCTPGRSIQYHSCSRFQAACTSQQSRTCQCSFRSSTRRCQRTFHQRACTAGTAACRFPSLAHRLLQGLLLRLVWFRPGFRRQAAGAAFRSPSGLLV